MEVAMPGKPQKIFRSRKTMKMTDCQQLEALHNTLSAHSNSSSRPLHLTALVNGMHGEDGLKEIDKKTGTKLCSSPVPSCSVSLSRPLSPADSETQNLSPSFSLKKGSGNGKSEKKKGEKDKSKITKSARSTYLSVSDKKTEQKKTSTGQALNGELPMDTDGTSLDNGSVEEKSSKSIYSSISGFPAASLECDSEVKEGFLCLSEEDEGQAEQDNPKYRNEEKIDMAPEKEERKGGEKGCNVTDGTDTSTPSGKKRSLSPVEGKDGWKVEEIKEERDRKRARVAGVQLEAQLELKITANPGSRLKLEKVVQQLVEERLRVLQLTVFDRNIEELKDRMEKIDAATKQQKSVHMLQATLFNRRGPAVVNITNEKLLTFTRKLLNLEARVGWLEARLNEKALQSHLLTVDQSTSTDSAVDVPLLMPTPLEIQSNCQQLFKTPDHSTSASEHLDDADFGFPPAASKPLTDHTFKVQTDPENIASMGSTTHLGPTNHQQATGSMLDCKRSPVQEHAVNSPPSNTLQYCSEKPRSASHSRHHFRRSLIRGVILPDVILNHVSIKTEKQLYLNSAGSDGRPRADRFAVCLFKRLIPLNVYQNWAGTVNYDGSRGKNALPSNLRQAISDAVTRKFHPTAHDWKQIRDRINELLRKKRLSFPLF